jgi:hypothetical protein
MTHGAHAADREAGMRLLDYRRGLFEVQVAGEGRTIVLIRPEPRGTAMLAAVTGRSFATISSGGCVLFRAIPATPFATTDLHYRRTASSGAGQACSAGHQPYLKPVGLTAIPSAS